jgi:hypothetical protein
VALCLRGKRCFLSKAEKTLSHHFIGKELNFFIRRMLRMSAFTRQLLIAIIVIFKALVYKCKNCVLTLTALFN